MAIDSLETLTEYMRWIEASLQQLAANLQALGYEFENQLGPLAKSESSDTSIAMVESCYGELPKAYRLLYSTFAHIDFRQSHRQLHTAGSNLSGLGFNCPLVFVSLAEVPRLRDELVDSGFSVDVDGRRFLPTGDAASNCEPKGVWVPSTEIDPILFDDGAGPISLIDDLEGALIAGGFPIWPPTFKQRIRSSPLGHLPAYPTLLPQLLRGIDPPPKNR
jgi:hypothetical protein